MNVTNIQSNIFLCERTLLIEQEHSFVLLEPGYDAVCSGKYAGSSVEYIITYCQKQHKPITHIVFTHYHGDHTGNLTFYLQKISTPLHLVCHANSPIIDALKFSNLLREHKTLYITKPDTFTWDNVIYNIFPTLGHSLKQDDISIHMPIEKILFIGDIFQPQGSSYDVADGVSPVPYFFHGDAYLQTLETLIHMDFRVCITGHANILCREKAIQGLEVTQKTLQRIDYVAHELWQKYPKEIALTLSEQVYDAIAIERNFSLERLRERKISTHSQRCDYEIYDRPGILYFVYKHQLPLDKGSRVL